MDANDKRTDMTKEEGDAGRRRREWLLRVSSQSQQRQQGGTAGSFPARSTGTWRPAPGWAGQANPQALLPLDDTE
jgi:hypothetical protein